MRLDEFDSYPASGITRLMYNKEDEDIARCVMISRSFASLSRRYTELGIRAITFSFKERPRHSEVTVIDSDDEDVRYQKDLQQALEASKVSGHSLPVSSPLGLSKKEEPKQGLSSFLLERAKLEKERLERQKRLRGETARGKMKAVKDDSDSETKSDGNMDGPPPKRHHMSKLPQGNSNPSSRQEKFFWNGELRQTATRYTEERMDRRPTFRLTQVLGSVSLLCPLQF